MWILIGLTLYKFVNNNLTLQKETCDHSQMFVGLVSLCIYLLHVYILGTHTVLGTRCFRNNVALNNFYSGVTAGTAAISKGLQICGP